MNRTKKNPASYFYLSLCILCWALIPVASKKILAELDNYQMLFFSAILSTLILGAILITEGKTETLKQYSKRDYFRMGMLGFLGTFLYYVLLYRAFSLTTASEGFILAYTWPTLVVILAFFILKEALTLNKILALCISFLGIVVIVTHGQVSSFHFSNAAGDLLALSGAFIFAVFSILGKKYNFDKTISVFIYFVVSVFFAALALLFFSSVKLPSMACWLWLMLNGLFINGVSYIFWFKALEYGETSMVSNGLYLIPFLSLAYISLLLHERILASSIFGLLMIMIGLVIQSIGDRI